MSTQNTPISLEIIPKNLPHNVPAKIQRAKNSLQKLAQLYWATEVAGQAEATQAAKQRDLSTFLSFYLGLYGHDHPEEWYASVTREFLKQLTRGKVQPPGGKSGKRPSPATVARTYATVRHFARWLDKMVQPFPMGCPTNGVKPPPEPESDWKGLSRADELRLLNAAQTLRVRPGRGTNQGLRDHALLATLLGSGLRVSEVVRLQVEQYTGKGFAKVLQKGNHIREFVPLHRDARDILEEWLAERGKEAGPLFPTRTGGELSRFQVNKLLGRIAQQASAHLPPEQQIEVSPHVLRHTFLRKLAEEKGVQYAMEASGHRSDRYIWRYVKPDRQSLAEAIDELD